MTGGGPRQMTQQNNGHSFDLDAQATNEAAVIEEIRNVASRIQGVERVGSPGVPFDQKAHTLMLESVDRIAHIWFCELNHVRENTKVVEDMVIAQAAKAKDELTKLHLLGVQAMKEAQRGQEVVAQLGEQLDAMMAEHARPH